MERDPVFKGATRPVMWFGVPQFAMLGLMLLTVLLSMWSFILINGFVAFGIGLSSIFIFFLLRIASTDDPHRLAQMLKRFESAMRAGPNKSHWGAHSASPREMRKKKYREAE